MTSKQTYKQTGILWPFDTPLQWGSNCCSFSFSQHFGAMCTWFCKDSYEFAAAAAACLGLGFLSSYFGSSRLGYSWWLWMSSAKPQCSLTRYTTSTTMTTTSITPQSAVRSSYVVDESSLQKPNANQVKGMHKGCGCHLQNLDDSMHMMMMAWELKISYIIPYSVIIPHFQSQRQRRLHSTPI